MTPQTVQTLAEWCGASLAQGDPRTLVSQVSTDTRTIVPGSLFVALSGENFDAHEFSARALEAGAAALLVSRPVSVPAEAAVLVVPDVLTALQRMAREWRRIWGGTVIGITGSNGKTSTKDLLHSVLKLRGPLNATKGNLNNHIGLPLSVLATDPQHRFGVFELGMNHFGEIAPLAEIAAPDAGIITNIGTAHIEFMGSREGIAREKGVLAEAVHPDGCVVLNANDDFTPSIAARCRAKVITAGIGQGDVQVTELTDTESGCSFTLHLPDGSSGGVTLSVPGRHMAGNAALAAACAWHYGLSLGEIVQGLEAAAINKGRLQFRSAGGLRFLDDSYNANPESMRAALETLRTLAVPGRRIAVLGRMAELGATAHDEHLTLGRIAAAAGIDHLVLVGSADVETVAEGFRAAGGAAENLVIVPDQISCADHLRAFAAPDDLILVKGSRSSAMEKVIEQLSR